MHLGSGSGVILDLDPDLVTQQDRIRIRNTALYSDAKK